jgi:hypothetical protein
MQTNKKVRDTAQQEESYKLEKVLSLSNISTMLEAAASHRSGFTKFSAVVQVIARGKAFTFPGGRFLISLGDCKL